jgi:hypothetical protein
MIEGGRWWGRQKEKWREERNEKNDKEENEKVEQGGGVK